MLGFHRSTIACAAAAFLSIAALGPVQPAEAQAAGALQIAQTQILLTDLPPGIARPLIVDLQTQLTQRGYRPGPIDGVVGGQTRAAIRAYQRDAGLPVDGRATQGFLDTMKFAQPQVTASSSRPSTVHRPPAASDPLVLEIQKALNARGYDTGGTDGIAGAKTHAAAADFRLAAGLPGGSTVDQTLLDQLKTTDPTIGAGS